MRVTAPGRWYGCTVIVIIEMAVQAFFSLIPVWKWYDHYLFPCIKKRKDQGSGPSLTRKEEVDMAVVILFSS